MLHAQCHAGGPTCAVCTAECNVLMCNPCDHHGSTVGDKLQLLQQLMAEVASRVVVVDDVERSREPRSSGVRMIYICGGKAQVSICRPALV